MNPEAYIALIVVLLSIAWTLRGISLSLKKLVEQDEQRIAALERMRAEQYEVSRRQIEMYDRLEAEKKGLIP